MEIKTVGTKKQTVQAAAKTGGIPLILIKPLLPTSA
jgi:hypothetical protein